MIEKEEQKELISRRGMLKGSLCLGVCLAARGMMKEAEAAVDAKGAADRPEAARRHFLKSMNCSQAILENYAPLYGVKPELAGKLATGFAGGMTTSSRSRCVAGRAFVS